MQLRITNFCVRGFYPAFLANASISPIAEPSAIPILVAPRIETHCFLPLPSARLSAPNLKKLSFNPGQEVSSKAGKLVQLSDLKFQTEDQVGRGYPVGFTASSAATPKSCWVILWKGM